MLIERIQPGMPVNWRFPLVVPEHPCWEEADLLASVPLAEFFSLYRTFFIIFFLCPKECHSPTLDNYMISLIKHLIEEHWRAAQKSSTVFYIRVRDSRPKNRSGP
jgi:hypothetical protein